MSTQTSTDPPDAGSTGCAFCGLIPIILEKVNKTQLDVALIMEEILGLKGSDSWKYEWTYQLKPNFSEEQFPEREGTGKGLAGIVRLINSAILINTDIHKDLSAQDGTIAIPEHWQIPLEAQRPQLVVQSAEEMDNGSLDSAKYVTTIPHYRYTSLRDTPPFDYMDKGSTQGMLILKDNSKVIIYAKNQNEATRVINKIKNTIDPDFLENSYVKLGRIQNENMKEIRVYPKFGRFYDKGVKENFKWQTGYKRI